MVLSVLAGDWTPLLAAESQVSDLEFQETPHDYWSRPLRDPVTRLKAGLENGTIALERSSERAFLVSLLKVLRIPATSQLLVFSTTSLQLRLISPSNPRALYFNEEVYLGYIPGGRIEVAALDPALGAIFYIFDIPRGTNALRFERSDRCMNCHASEDTSDIPGLVVRSVLPGPSGGSLRAFRSGRTGHAIPYEDRLGGWFVTGQGALTNHWGNVLGQPSPGGPTRRAMAFGTSFDIARYPVATSDALAHLLHEHQIGFLNRIVHATYRARACLHESKERLGPEHERLLDQHADELVRYILFADEAALPSGGLGGDPFFKKDFLSERRTAKDGSSLKDLELRTRLFRYRCSYMLYTTPFQELPAVVKGRVYAKLKAALNEAVPDPAYAYMPSAEKQAIRRILGDTLPDLPRDW